ncbi:MAG TPA: hypothetical protein VH374_10325 [Polyangia bacterium]|jgi:hypothetical protein|nr:hypothetical protein [Polyangia bacterium]
MSRRDDIINRALYWSDPGSYRVAPDDLIYFFQTAGTEVAPTGAEAKEAMGYGGGVKVQGHAKQWCGIFATCVLRECGLDASWTLMGGKMRPSSDVKLVWGNQGMQPGDVALIASASHHFIVVDVDYNKNTIHSVDGNQAWQTIKELTSRKVRYPRESQQLQPYGYYRIGG